MKPPLSRFMAVVGALCLFLGACADGDSSEVAGIAESRGVLRIAHELSWGGGELLNPASSAPMKWATALVFDGLVAAAPNGEPAPRLAQSWEANAQATAWTFDLVDGVLFHDGTTFGAEDVQATIENIAASDSPLAGVLSGLDRVEVLDALTVRFHFDEPTVDFPLLMTDNRMRMLSSEAFHGGQADAVVGTGPFVVTKFDPRHTTVLGAFDEYWAGRPNLAGVEIVAMPDADSRLAAVTSGRLHLLDNVGAAEAAQLAGRVEFELQQVPSGDWRGIAFDTRAKPYDDPRVRQALKLVVDRSEMIELVAGGSVGAEVSCDTPVWSADPYRIEQGCAQDVDQARRLLEQAGYPDGIDVSISTAQLYSDWIPMVEVFQYQAAQAGIRVEIAVADSDGYWSDVWMNDDAVTTSWTQRTAEQVLNEAFVSGARWNESFWTNEDFDRMVGDAAREPDPGLRAALYSDAQRLLQEDSGTIIPYHVKKTRVVSANLSGIEDGLDRYAVAWHEVALATDDQP